MQRDGFLNGRRVDISERNHVVEAILTPILVAAPSAELRRILEGAKENVPDRQVAKVIGVMAELMMDAMRLRPLEEIAEPARRLDVPMIKEFAQGDEQRVIAGRFDAASEQRKDDQAAEERVDPDLDWMLVETRQDFEATCGVMDLMQGAPEELRFVPVPMPPVINKGGEDINDQRGTPRPEQAAKVKEGSVRETAIPG